MSAAMGPKEGRAMEKSSCRVSMIFGVAAAILVAQGGRAQTVSETVTYFHTDRLGSTVMTSDASGNIQSTIDYRPYGQPVQNDPGPAPGYTGQYNDPATGLTYMRARYYDTNVGRFLGTDPIASGPADVFAFNRYAYANANPMTFTDPTGMKTLGTITVKGYNTTGGTASGAFSYGGGGTPAREGRALDQPDPKNATNLDGFTVLGYIHDFTLISGGMLVGGNIFAVRQPQESNQQQRRCRLDDPPIEPVCPECYVMGFGRLAYAGLAKLIPFASASIEDSVMAQAAYANAARNSLKDLFRGPLAPILAGIRQPTLAASFAKYNYDAVAVITAASRTNAVVNAVGVSGVAVGAGLDVANQIACQ